MEFIFDFRTVGEGEAHAAEDADGLVADQGEGVEGAVVEAAGGEGGVDPGECLGIGGGLEFGLFGLDGGGDGVAGGVEELADFGFLLFWDIAHAGGDFGERALFPEDGDTGVFEGAGVVGGGKAGECFGLDGIDLFLHGGAGREGIAGGGSLVNG